MTVGFEPSDSDVSSRRSAAFPLVGCLSPASLLLEAVLALLFPVDVSFLCGLVLLVEGRGVLLIT